MPLSLKSPFQLLGRRRTSKESMGSGSSAAAAASVPAAASSAPANQPTEERRRRSSEVDATLSPQGGRSFRVKVPTDARPGQSIRVRAPDGRLVEIDLPPNCRPGQSVTIEVDAMTGVAKGADKTLKQLQSLVKSNFDAVQASCRTLRERLKEELELQKGLWLSAASCPQSYSVSQSAGNSLGLALHGNQDELSQTQVIVFAAAEIGDCKQLSAALQEARKFSTVAYSLEECCNSLHDAEDKMLIWQCLLDALQAENRHQIEVWLEEARSLGFVAPGGTSDALEELRNREVDNLRRYESYKETETKKKETEDKLKIAMETADVETLTQVLAEAEAVGLQNQVVQQAKSQLRAQERKQVEAALGGPPRQPPTNGRASGSASGPQPMSGPQWHPRPRSPPRGEGPSQPQGTAHNRRSSESPPPLFPKVEPERPNYNDPRWNSHSSMGGAQSSSFAGGPEAGAGPSQPSRASASYSHQPADDGKTVRELLEECKRLGIETRGCTDRNDLQRLILNTPKPKEEPRSTFPPQGFVTQMQRPASAPQGMQAPNPADANTVWSRQYPPPHYVTKRAKCMYLLGLDPVRSVSQAEIRSAYRKAAMECHPDRAQNHARANQAKELFQSVKEAFDFLST